VPFQLAVLEITDPGPNFAEAAAADGSADRRIVAIAPALLDEIPRRVSDPDANPGGLVNILILGTEDELVHAFTAAGWARVDHSVQETLISGLADSLEKKDHLTMPMSTLYIFNRPQDYRFAHAEPVRVAISRNHLRAWKSAFRVEGRPVWRVDATHDIGFQRDERNNGAPPQNRSCD
jgi:LssY C-terminus